MVAPHRRVCAVCGARGELHEHYLVPLVFGGHEQPTVMLCVAHHGQVHTLAFPMAHSVLTRAGLARARAGGVSLGNPRLKPGTRDLAAAANTAKARLLDGFVRAMAPHVGALRRAGITSLPQIAAALNAHGLLTRHGGLWHPMTVSRLLKRIDALD